MDQPHNLQDVIRCQLCDNPNPELYCTVCQINLCKNCAGEHLLDESKIHTVIPIKQQRSTPHYPTCPKHSTKQCELHCAKCDIPICIRCISSEEHSEHKAEDIMTTFQIKKETLQSDIQELEKFLIQEYQKMADSIRNQKDLLDKGFQKLLEVISKREDDWHRVIEKITQKEKIRVDDMKNKCMHTLDEQEGEINKQISQIRRHTSELDNLLDNNDVYLISSYKSTNAEFKRLPSKVIITIPTFSSQEIDTEQVREKFGTLSEYYIKKDEKKDALKTESKTDKEKGSLITESKTDKEKESLKTESKKEKEKEFIKTESKKDKEKESIKTESKTDKEKESLKTEIKKGKEKESIRTESKKDKKKESIKSESKKEKEKESLEKEPSSSDRKIPNSPKLGSTLNTFV